MPQKLSTKSASRNFPLKKGQTNKPQVDGKDDGDEDDDDDFKRNSELTKTTTSLPTEKIPGQRNLIETSIDGEKNSNKNFPTSEILQKKQESITDTKCPSTFTELIEQKSKENNYVNRNNFISLERMNELRRRVQEALKQHKTFTIRGCFYSIRQSLVARGWVEKLDIHRKQAPSGICQVTYEDISQNLPKRKVGESRRLYVVKCERNVMSRLLEHVPIDLLWTARKEKCDYIDQTKNASMIINKIHRVPFTSKEGLCTQLKDFHWYYENGTAELYFPRCFNAWSPEELTDFIDNFKITACISVLRLVFDKFGQNGSEGIFSESGYVPYSALDFAIKRCNEHVDACQHKDIDSQEDASRIWEHDWDVFFGHHHLLTSKTARVHLDVKHNVEPTINAIGNILEKLRIYSPQFNVDGYLNLWIIKPANKCRGRGIHLLDNLRKILFIVNPATASKSRYVVQKYIERPLIIHSTKFDIRQWFLVTSVSPLIIWMYKESYLRFSTQEYSLLNHHESIHLTNHAIQKKYRSNGMRDKRLPVDNMWDCYSFQAYLRQIGKHDMWEKRIYPGMQKAITGAVLASQENMDRRPNNFELFGADFMICENFYPWLLEINSSPDLGGTTSVTARMCPQCLEDVVKVVIDRRADPKADTGSFEMIHRQLIPQTPAYMGLNLYLKGKQIITKKERKERNSVVKISNGASTTSINTNSNSVSHMQAMPTFNATEYLENTPSNSSQIVARRSRALLLKKPSICTSNLGPSYSYSSGYRNIVKKEQQKKFLSPIVATYSTNFPQKLSRQGFSSDLVWSNRFSSLSDQSINTNRFLSCGPSMGIDKTGKYSEHNLIKEPEAVECCLKEKEKCNEESDKILTTPNVSDKSKVKLKNSPAKPDTTKNKQKKKIPIQKNTKNRSSSAKSVWHDCGVHINYDNNFNFINNYKFDNNVESSFQINLIKTKEEISNNRGGSCGPRLSSHAYSSKITDSINNKIKENPNTGKITENPTNSEEIENEKRKDTKNNVSPLLIRSGNSKKSTKFVKKDKSNLKRALSSKNLKKSPSLLLNKPMGYLFRKSNNLSLTGSVIKNSNTNLATTSFHAIGKSLKMNKNKENAVIWKRLTDDNPTTTSISAEILSSDNVIAENLNLNKTTHNNPLHKSRRSGRTNTRC